MIRSSQPYFLSNDVHQLQTFSGSREFQLRVHTPCIHPRFWRQGIVFLDKPFRSIPKDGHRPAGSVEQQSSMMAVLIWEFNPSLACCPVQCFGNRAISHQWRLKAKISVDKTEEILPVAGIHSQLVEPNWIKQLVIKSILHSFRRCQYIRQDYILGRTTRSVVPWMIGIIQRINLRQIQFLISAMLLYKIICQSNGSVIIPIRISFNRFLIFFPRSNYRIIRSIISSTRMQCNAIQQVPTTNLYQLIHKYFIPTCHAKWNQFNCLPFRFFLLHPANCFQPRHIRFKQHSASDAIFAYGNTCIIHVDFIAKLPYPIAIANHFFKTSTNRSFTHLFVPFLFPINIIMEHRPYRRKICRISIPQPFYSHSLQQAAQIIQIRNLPIGRKPHNAFLRRRKKLMRRQYANISSGKNLLTPLIVDQRGFYKKQIPFLLRPEPDRPNNTLSAS